MPAEGTCFFPDPSVLNSEHQPPLLGGPLQQPQRMQDVLSSAQQQQAVPENYMERREGSDAPTDRFT